MEDHPRRIFALRPGPRGGLRPSILVIGAGGVVHLGFGPDGGGQSRSLYYATFDGGGQIRKIAPAR